MNTLMIARMQNSPAGSYVDRNNESSTSNKATSLLLSQYCTAVDGNNNTTSGEDSPAGSVASKSVHWHDNVVTDKHNIPWQLPTSVRLFVWLLNHTTEQFEVLHCEVPLIPEHGLLVSDVTAQLPSLATQSNLQTLQYDKLVTWPARVVLDPTSYICDFPFNDGDNVLALSCDSEQVDTAITTFAKPLMKNKALQKALRKVHVSGRGLQPLVLKMAQKTDDATIVSSLDSDASIVDDVETVLSASSGDTSVCSGIAKIERDCSDTLPCGNLLDYDRNKIKNSGHSNWSGPVDLDDSNVGDFDPVTIQESVGPVDLDSLLFDRESDCSDDNSFAQADPVFGKTSHNANIMTKTRKLSIFSALKTTTTPTNKSGLVLQHKYNNRSVESAGEWPFSKTDDITARDDNESVDQGKQCDKSHTKVGKTSPVEIKTKRGPGTPLSHRMQRHASVQSLICKNSQAESLDHEMVEANLNKALDYTQAKTLTKQNRSRHSRMRYIVNNISFRHKRNTKQSKKDTSPSSMLSSDSLHSTGSDASTAPPSRTSSFASNEKDRVDNYRRKPSNGNFIRSAVRRTVSSEGRLGFGNKDVLLSQQRPPKASASFTEGKQIIESSTTGTTVITFTNETEGIIVKDDISYLRMHI